MRTGLKTIIRTALEKTSHALDQKYGVFPEVPTPKLIRSARMRALSFDLAQSGIRNNLGLPVTVPHRAAIRMYHDLISQNPGHLGMQTRHGNSTATLEADVLQCMASLYREDPNRVKGYITSGGTEGNFFALHLGLSSLAKHIGPSQISLLLTPLTHYSVSKAARMMRIPVRSIPVDGGFGMDVRAFDQTVRIGYARGCRGFLVALTAGYTETGTSDAIDSIAMRARQLSRILPDLRFHIALDAAFSGLTLPFDSSGFAPFAHPFVQSVVTDFHKFGMVPFSAGVILYRSRLLPRVTQPIPYLPQKDTTLLGSRSGIPGAAIWAVIHALGKTGFTRLVKQQIHHAELFVSLLTPLNSKIRIIHAPESLIMGLIVKGRGLPKDLEERYWLHPSCGFGRVPGMERRDKLYSIHFMPHVSDRLIRSFSQDLHVALSK